MSDCDICGREKGPVPPLCGRERDGATFPDMADCYSTGFYRLKRELAAAEERGRRGAEMGQADLLLECEEALIWCSAADAFKPDGIAAQGWLRVVLPVLERVRITRKSLATRDSAPKRDPYVEAGVDDWSGAPRDSGKERKT